MVLGIDIGTTAIKIAVLKGSARAPKLHAFVVEDIPPSTSPEEWRENAAATLRRIFEDGKVAHGEAGAAVTSHDCVIRGITVPFIRDEQIARTIKFQAESFFHACPIERAIVDYAVVARVLDETKGKKKGAGKTRLLVAGLPKDAVASKLALLGEAGLDPAFLDLDAGALVTVARRAGRIEGQGVVLIVDIGARHLRIVVVEDGRLRLVRALRIRDPRDTPLSEPETPLAVEPAPAQATEAPEEEQPDIFVTTVENDDVEQVEWDLAQKIDSGRLPVVVIDDEEEAAAAEEEPVQAPPEPLAEAPARPAGPAKAPPPDLVRRVTVEIQRTLASLGIATAPRLILTTGIGAEVPSLGQRLADAAGVEVDRLDPAKALASAGDASTRARLAVSGAIALGLALRALGVAGSTFDFRKEEYAFQRKFDALKVGLAATACLLFLLAFLLTSYIRTVSAQRQERLDLVMDQERKIFATLFPGATPSYDKDFVLSTEDKIKELKQSLGEYEDLPQIVSSLDILRDFASAVRESDMGNVTFSQITVNQHNTEISGWSDHLINPGQVPSRYKSAAGYKVELVKSGADKDRYVFQYRIVKPEP